ncbi:MAG: hypothetical protein EPO11_09360 [Gammaproteobacteria bacterium]|nr:MAG: hypothetical protein EPO11_09360 [Gammaproteobacteria bacterium]
MTILEPNIILLIFLFLGGLFAGTVDAIAGGGGLISLPLLISFGLPPHIALGTNKLQASAGTFVATYNYFKNGLISLNVVLKGLLFGFLGATSGAMAAQFLDSGILQKLLPFLMVIIFIYSLYIPKLGLHDSHQKMPENIFYILFGFILGFYDGFLGPAVGSIWVITLVYFLGYNMAKATAYTKLFNLKSNIIAFTCFALGHNVNYKWGIAMIAGQLIGGKLGSSLVIKKGAQLVRPIFLVVVSITIIVMVYKSWILRQ